MRRTSEYRDNAFENDERSGRRQQNGAQNPMKSERFANEGQGLRQLFLAELQDIYWAEKALVKALPKMADKATSQELVDAITEHLGITEQHVSRLEDVFEAIGEKAQGKKCDAMAGLIEEAEYIVDGMPEGNVRDAAIIASAQKVEHYEIAAYGTLCAFAKTLGETQAGELLHETLEEEKEADEKLTDIAVSSVNDGAAENEEGFTAKNKSSTGEEESTTRKKESEGASGKNAFGSKKGPEHWGEGYKKEEKVKQHISSKKESKNWAEDSWIGEEDTGREEERKEKETTIDAPGSLKSKEIVDEHATEDEYRAKMEGRMKIEDNEGLIDEPLTEEDQADASPGIISRRGTGSPDDEIAER